MSDEAAALVERIRAAFEPRRDEARAAGMRKYMRDQFPFLGLPTTERRALTRTALAGLPRPSEAVLLGTARALWAMPEREYQYAALDLLARNVKTLTPQALPVIEELLVTKSWWDTVDGLASSLVGPLVLGHPELADEMERWIESDNKWLARAAILHHLGHGARTDQERLFRFCLRRSGDTDFFLRKAIGWALRQYSKTDPKAVQAFLAEHDAELSPLSKREALLWITGRPGSARRAALEAESPGG